MLNLIRMNFYRMFHTKSMLIILTLVTMGVAALNTYMEKWEFKHRDELGQTVSGLSVSVSENNQTDSDDLENSEDTDDGGFGIYIETPKTEDGKPAAFLRYYAADIGSGVLLIFVTIASVLFVNNEEKSGFIKNIAGQTKHKYNIYLSKLVTLAVYIIMLFAAYGIAQLVTFRICFGGEMEFGADLLGKFVPVLGLEYLLAVAFASGLIMITSILRNNTAGIVIGLLAACGIAEILFNFLQRVVDINLGKYTVVRTIGTLNPDMTKSVGLHALLIGTLFIIVYNVIGTFIFVKKDVV